MGQLLVGLSGFGSTEVASKVSGIPGSGFGFTWGYEELQIMYLSFSGTFGQIKTDTPQKRVFR